jgi:hypothetical protein
MASILLPTLNCSSNFSSLQPASARPSRALTLLGLLVQNHLQRELVLSPVRRESRIRTLHSFGGLVSRDDNCVRPRHAWGLLRSGPFWGAVQEVLFPAAIVVCYGAVAAMPRGPPMVPRTGHINILVCWGGYPGTPSHSSAPNRKKVKMNRKLVSLSMILEA